VRHITSLFFAALLAVSYSATATTGPVPKTVAEAIQTLEVMVPPAQRKSLMERSEAEALTEAHFGLGMYIRNNWFRSGKSDLPRLLGEAGAKSMDDMSALILSAYWRHLHGRSFDLAREAGCYRDWWAEQARIEANARASGKPSYGSPSFTCPR
jgi:hypothetical protein